jgi:hypothetical protein
MDNRIEINFDNYNTSVYQNVKNGKNNILKILFPILVAIYVAYVYIYKFLKSRVPFVKDEHYAVLKNEAFNNYLADKNNYFSTTRYKDVSNSFNLKNEIPETISEYYENSTTKEGIINFIFYEAFLPSCLNIYYDPDICTSLKYKYNVFLFYYGNNYDNNTLVFSNLSLPYTLGISVDSQNNEIIKRVVYSDYFVKSINNLFSSHLVFYKLEFLTIT